MEQRDFRNNVRLKSEEVCTKNKKEKQKKLKYPVIKVLISMEFWQTLLKMEQALY